MTTFGSRTRLTCRSAERDAVLELLAGGPPMAAKELADTLAQKRATIGMRLTRMARDGEVERLGDGTYSAILSPREAGSLAQ